MRSISAADVLVPTAADLPALAFLDRPASGPRARLALGGDVALSGATPPDALVALTPSFRALDLALANHEGALTDSPFPPGLFAAPLARGADLGAAGFTHLGLANNHTRDHGAAGLAATKQALERAGIVPLGLAISDPLVVAERSGVRVGFLTAGRTLQDQVEEPRFRELDPERLVAEVQAARPQVDALVVFLHLGFMYVDYPSPDHRALTHRLVAAGADVVACHHAHLLQGIERVGRGLVAHNLGNLLVDPNEGALRSPVLPALQREGGLLVVSLDRDGLASAAFVPTVIGDDLRVAWPRVARAEAILDRLERVSRELGQPGWEDEFARQRAERNADLGLAELGLLAKRGRVRDLARMLRRARVEHLGMLWRRWRMKAGGGE